MLLRSIFSITLTSAAVLLIGCGGPESTGNVNSTNVNSATTNVNSSNSNSPLSTTKKPEGEKTNDAPTLKPVVDAYYDALKKKDDAAVRKVLSSALLKQTEAEMKEEKKTNLAEYIGESDRTDEAVQVRNEVITGDKATAELKGGVYINWSKLVFVKENGVWKMSAENPDIQAVDQSKGK